MLTQKAPLLAFRLSCGLYQTRFFGSTSPLFGHWRQLDYKRARAKAKRLIYRNHNQHSDSDCSLTGPSPSSHVPNYKKSESDNSVHNHVGDQLEMIFGIHSVFAALQAEKRHFECLYIRVSIFKELSNHSSTKHETPILQQVLNMANYLSIPVIPVNKSKLDRLATYGVHQGVILTATPINIPRLDSVTSLAERSDSFALWILISNVVDPMNLGALIRTAVYFGLDRIITSPSCSKLSPVVSKASSGAMEFAPLCHAPDLPNLLSSLKLSNWSIIGTSSGSDKAAVPPSSLSLDRNTLIIVGNENGGIDKDVLSYCTSLVKIPSSQSCPSYIDSLNVSVAGGVILSQLHHLRAQ